MSDNLYITIGRERIYYERGDVDDKTLKELEKMPRSQVDQLLKDAMSAKGGRYADFIDERGTTVRIERINNKKFEIRNKK